MKVSIQNGMLLVILAACASMLRGQAMVEAGLGAARAATSTAGAKEAGKSIAGAFANLDKALKPAAQAQSDTTIVPAAGKVSAPEAPKKTYEDIAKAKTGLSYEELVDRFGPPAMEVTGQSGGKTMTYGKNGSTRIEIEDGKVASIKTASPQQAVFTLPSK
jgi:hypothetical protein